MAGFPNPPEFLYERVCGRAIRALQLPPALAGILSPTSQNSIERIINLAPFAGPSPQSFHQQTQSPFFRLPVEIRYEIYSHVLPPGKRIWVRPAPAPRTSSSMKQPDRVTEVSRVCVEHFPCRTPPRDLGWTEPRAPAACCKGPSFVGFWGHVGHKGMEPDENALGLMRVCQRMYLELYDICSFCFDDLGAIHEFADVYPALPIQHIQIVLYASCLLYKDFEGSRLMSATEYARWAMKLNTSWERKLQEVDEACRRLKGLTSLLISLHPEPVYHRFLNEERLLESLQAISGVPTIYVEVLGGAVQGRNREPFLFRSGGCLVSEMCKSSV